ncbi:MAG TPA: thioredoxin domain-containing protein [Bacteriovoracaceae bacterium]|nr:thioredoxin domain-containing protein [Bacteriovoracaceae bacterium]
MEPRKSLTLNGLTGRNFLFIINAALMIGVSIYLTTHFYETVYPTKLGAGKSLCDISSYFNCDAATFSKISNIAGVPISFFGIIVGLLFLFSSLMPSEALEKTASAVSKINFIGCVILFIFSLTVLGSLCPFCTVYYLLSLIACGMLWKYGINTWVPDLKTGAFWGVAILVGSFFMHQHTAGKADIQSKLNTSIVSQFRGLATIGEPDEESPYKIHMGTKTFAESPIKMSIFSDFECPYCKVVSEQMHELIRRYPNKLSIQYYYFPLDSKCNSNIKGGFHKNACDAAMLAACDEKKFAEVHDDIFANQDKISEILPKLAEKHDLKGCLDNKDMLNKVIASVNQATKFNIKSTPTVILNGKKIEGSIPSSQYFAIFEDILAGNK